MSGKYRPADLASPVTRVIKAFLADLWKDSWASAPFEPEVEIEPATWPERWGGSQAYS
jgi:hypothetical protein